MQYYLNLSSSYRVGLSSDNGTQFIVGGYYLRILSQTLKGIILYSFQNNPFYSQAPE